MLRVVNLFVQQTQKSSNTYSKIRYVLSKLKSAIGHLCCYFYARVL